MTNEESYVVHWRCLYCGGHAPCIKPECREALVASKKRMGISLASKLEGEADEPIEPEEY